MRHARGQSSLAPYTSRSRQRTTECLGMRTGVHGCRADDGLRGQGEGELHASSRVDLELATVDLELAS